jgi:hypothetical protein
MTSTQDCRAYRAHFVDYLNSALPADEHAKLQVHIHSCTACRQDVQSMNEINGLLRGAFNAGEVSRDFAAKMNARFVDLATPAKALPEVEDPSEQAFLMDSIKQRFGAAPWWAVSATLHVLVVLLSGLISMAVELPAPEDALVMVTELAPAPNILPAAEQKKEEHRNALEGARDVPPTDLNSREISQIVVPPEILLKAELGDHFETNNPDREDTQSAFGSPDARMFHSERGSDEPEGGGGAGGSSLEDMIGVGSSGSPGTGGGWVGGNGTGSGVGTGSGHGSFGNRMGGGRKLMVKKHGGSAATESSVEKALEWLARNQEADGSWKVKKHGGSLPDTCSIGVSGLATLAFLGAGHTEKVGKYKEHVKKALEYLMSQQNPDGSIGNNNQWNGWVTGSGYNHPIAGLALAEAYAMAKNPKVQAAAQSALYYSCEKHFNEQENGWRYALPDTCMKQGADMAVDISATGWFIMQLKSAKVAGMDVERKYFVAVFKLMDSLKDQKAKGGDYGSHRYGYCKRQPKPTVANTSMGMLCHLFMGTASHELTDGADFLLTELPQWDAANGKTSAPRGPCPHYYWYYGTLCMFQMGGEHWDKWNAALKKVLLENQRQDGDFAGSWDLLGNDGPFAGRAYTTALGALSLEVYYRYAKLNPGH